MAPMVTILYPVQVDATVAEASPAEYPLRYLAEGDSWFSFGSWKLQSMLTQLRLRRMTALLTLAQPGDTIRRMSDIARNPELENWLTSRYAEYRWNALLMSGGGNDVIDDATAIIPASATDQAGDKRPEEYIDVAR